MDALTAIAAAGMRSRTETLDLLANNLANAGTAGYKADGESYDLYFGDDAWDGVNQNRPAWSEMPLVQRNWTDFSQGTLLDTGNMGDIALTSQGFFVVQTAGGPLYTRSGHFKVAKNGQLQTPEGYQVVGQNGNPVQLDPSKTFSVSNSGQILQDGNPVATLQVLDVQTVDGLTKRGNTYFSLSPSAKTTPVANPEIAQGKVESSNVNPSTAAVKLVGVLRQFEMLQRAVHIAGDMGKQATEQVAKVG